MHEMDLYDLSNFHFSKVKLILKSNRAIEGCFVRFKVNCEGGLEIFPGEKLCFVPQNKIFEFKKLFSKGKNEISYFPDYIIQLTLDEIKQIIIEPFLV